MMEVTPNLAELTLKAILGAVNNLFNKKTRMIIFINLQDNHKTPPLFGVKSEKLKSHPPNIATASVTARRMSPSLNITTQLFMPSKYFIIHTTEQQFTPSKDAAPDMPRSDIIEVFDAEHRAEQSRVEQRITHHSAQADMLAQHLVPLSSYSLTTLVADIYIPCQLSGNTFALLSENTLAPPTENAENSLFTDSQPPNHVHWNDEIEVFSTPASSDEDEQVVTQPMGPAVLAVPCVPQPYVTEGQLTEIADKKAIAHQGVGAFHDYPVSVSKIPPFPGKILQSVITDCRWVQFEHYLDCETK